MDIQNDVLNLTLPELLHINDSTSNDYQIENALDRNSIANWTHIYGPTRDPLYIVIPITIIYAVIFLTGIIGNISTCIVISKNRSMHTATNYYLFSLAISDFLLLLSGVPQEVYQIWFKYPYVFGEVFCVVRGLIAETSANATVLTITSFTVERYLAICHPFLQHTMSKLSRAIRLILIVWIVSICLAIPQALQFGVITDQHHMEFCTMKRTIIEHSFELSTVLIFLTPMSLITILYILIGLKLRTSGIIKHEHASPLQNRIYVNSHRQQTSIGTRRVLKMLVAVVFAFFVCWAPFHVQRLVAFYYHEQTYRTIYAITTYVSGILYYLSTCINPLLYNIMSNKFREAFKETLAQCFKQKRNNSNSTYRILSRRQRRWNGYQESGDYSGSSVRDDSLHSTATQRQSFYSMTTTQSQPSRMRFDYDINCDRNTGYVIQPSIQINSNSKRLTATATAAATTCRIQDHNIELWPKSDVNPPVENEIIKNIQINVNCSNALKPRNKSKLIRYFQNIFRSKLQARNTGYYSPRNKHSIDVINVNLSSIVQSSAAENEDNSDEIIDQCIHLNVDGNNEVDDAQSNSCSDDDAKMAKDELTAYMEELRLREIR